MDSKVEAFMSEIEELKVKLQINIVSSRALALVITKLDEAQLWLTKAEGK